MLSDLAIIVPGVLGSICLLVVCVVYVRSQRLQLDGTLLALCGVALLGLAVWQVTARDRALPDLLAQIDARLEAIAQRQAELAAPGAAAAPPAPSVAPGSGQPAVDASVLEIEVLGGVSDDELAAIIAWIRRVKREHRTSAIFVEPVIPLGSTDPAGQRQRLMSEAGRVIDHVYVQLNQRIDIASLVSEDVPGLRLRLGF
jgi:hypothetical protein